MSTWYDEQTVLQAVPSRIIAVYADGTVSFANRAALSLLERTPYDVIGTPIVRVFDSPQLGERLREELPPGDHRFDIAWTSPSGVRRELGVNVARLLTRTASEVSHVLVFRDMGEWRQHEIELRRLKGMNALGQMAAGFAHEVRNPLAAMRSLAEALKGEMATDDPRIEYPTRMLNLTSRIDSLVKDALRFGRPKAPSFRMHAPQQLIAETFDTLAPRLGRGPRPVVETDDALPHVRVDDSQAVEILVNLVENAIDAAEDVERVRLRVYVDQDVALMGRFVRFDVVDNGPGMASETLARVFDPFFTTKSKGTGLGLAIAQRLARENGGHLIAASIRKTETTFSLLLPIAVESVELV